MKRGYYENIFPSAGYSLLCRLHNLYLLSHANPKIQSIQNTVMVFSTDFSLYCPIHVLEFIFFSWIVHNFQHGSHLYPFLFRFFIQQSNLYNHYLYYTDFNRGKFLSFYRFNLLYCYRENSLCKFPLQSAGMGFFSNDGVHFSYRNNIPPFSDAYLQKMASSKIHHGTSCGCPASYIPGLLFYSF